MSSLTTLPTEILDNIFDHCEARCTLKLLSSVCHRIHEAVEPHLYELVQETTQFTMIHFLRTILENPHLATYVNELKRKPCRYLKRAMTFHYYQGCIAPPDYMVYGVTFGMLLRTAISKRSSSQEETRDWFNAIRNVEWDATTALLLLLLPKIEHFQAQLSEPNCPLPHAVFNCNSVYFPWIEKVVGRAKILQQQGLADDALSLSTLNAVSLRAFDADMASQISDAVTYLRLPSVKAFRCGNWENWPFGPSITFPQITALEIMDGSMDLESFTRFLKAFPSVAHFSYSTRDTALGFTRRSPRLPWLPKTMAHLRHSLKELTVLDDQDCLYDHLVVDMAYTYASFTKLEVIWMSQSMLVGRQSRQEGASRPLVDMIPASIQRLVIRRCSARVVPAVREFLKKKQERAPLLVEVSVFFNSPKPNSDITRSEIACLRKESWRYGVMVYFSEEEDN